MKRTVFAFLIVIVLASAITSHPAFSQTNDMEKYIVLFPKEFRESDMGKILASADWNLSIVRGKVARLTEDDASRLQNAGAMVFKDYEVRALLDVSVPLISADDVWLKGIDGTGTRVCIIDTGVDDSHHDLKPLVAEYDFANGDGDATDDHGHGTHVAGIIASQDPKYKGVAPGASLMAAKVLDASGSGTASDVMLGIEWCVENGADIISMSLGGGLFTWTCDDDPIAQAVNSAVDRGVTVVVAAGNEGYSGMTSPGCASKAITVGAIDKNKIVPVWSSKGNELDIVAPGVSIVSTYLGNGFAYGTGTSMATPHVSGVAALLLQKNPALSPDGIRKAIRGNADPIIGCERWVCPTGTNCYVSRISATYCDETIRGAGIVNAYKAYLYIKLTEKDTDGDGILDSMDACPAVAGTYCNGCTKPTCSGCATAQCSGQGVPVCADNDTLCSTSNAAGDCVSGSCSFACIPGFGNCDGSWANGCEANLVTDPNHCGSCSSVCGVVPCGQQSGCGIGTCSEEEFGTFPPTQQQSCVQASCSGQCISTCQYNKDCDPDDDNDGVPDVSDACPDVAGTDCNGCPDPCTGCAVMACVQDTKSLPTCMAQDSLCPDTKCPANGCGVATCKASEFGTYTPAKNMCIISSNSGTCEANQCSVACAYDQSCEPNVMHIKSIAMSTLRNLQRTRGVATIEVVDTLGRPVEKAAIYGIWSGLAADTDSALTNVNGKAVVYSNWVLNAKGTFTFTVSNVKKTGWTYRPGQNVVTNGSITV
jgi:hypothetical protein